MIRDRFRAPVEYVAADGTMVGTPLVRASVAGVATLFVVDTGSDVHLLVRELADDIGLELSPGEDGMDASGTTMPSWSGGSVELELAESRVRLDGVVVIPAPPPFPGWGIGGILSPQHLLPGTWAVLDLAADELVLIDGRATEVAAWMERRSPSASLLTLPRDPAFTVPVVAGGIDDSAEFALVVDSGAVTTEVPLAAVPALAGSGEAGLGRAVSGTATVGFRAGRHTLRIGGRDVVVPDLGVRGGSAGPGHGFIGVDVLRGTTVACAADPREPVLWRVP